MWSPQYFKYPPGPIHNYYNIIDFLFPMLYFTFLGLFCDYQFVVLSPFTFYEFFIGITYNLLYFSVISFKFSFVSYSFEPSLFLLVSLNKDFYSIRFFEIFLKSQFFVDLFYCVFLGGGAGVSISFPLLFSFISFIQSGLCFFSFHFLLIFL